VIYQHLKSQNFTNLDIVGEDILNIRKLALSRLDLIAFDEAGFQYYLDLEDMDPALFDRIYRLDDISGGLYMAINKDSAPKLIRSLRSGLEAIKADGTYEQILNRQRVMN
jgi:polar amino acid transport system substrate-binding protein